MKDSRKHIYFTFDRKVIDDLNSGKEVSVSRLLHGRLVKANYSDFFGFDTYNIHTSKKEYNHVFDSNIIAIKYDPIRDKKIHYDRRCIKKSDRKY